jgi:hypothetical protein
MRTRPATTYGSAFGVTGIGVGIASVAIGLDQIDASPALVWSAAGVAGLCLAVGAALFAHASSAATSTVKSDPLLAAECRRLAKALAMFIDEIAHARTLIPAGGSTDAWEVEARRRYREEFQSWSARAFDAAVTAGAIVDCSRELVETPAPAQFQVVRDIFVDAAVVLDPLRRQHA